MHLTRRTVAGPGAMAGPPDPHSSWRFGISWLAAAWMILITSAPTRAQMRRITDESIIGAIQSELAVDDAVPVHLIEVRTEDGVVSLSGSVDNLLAHDRATEIVESTRGVRAVVDRLRVQPVIRSDAEIQEDIEQSLVLDPATEHYEIAVRVEGGRATLTGTVDSWAEKRLAEEVAKGISGLSKVRNNIKVRYDTERADREIRAEVRRHLESVPYLHSDAVEVDVQDGRIAYSGTVGSLFEKSQVGELGWVVGVRSVDTSKLAIDWEQEAMQRPPRLSVKSSDEVEEAVETALAHDPRVSPFAVDISALAGTVTLQGTVDNLMAKRAAERDAKNTVGVWQVRNDLKVRPVNPPSDDYIQQKIQQAWRRDAVLERYDLTALVRNQKVFLYGQVPAYRLKNRAEDVAARVFGVAAAENRIKVPARPATRSDDEIKEGIEDRFFWSILVDGGDIIVDVRDGVATLRGTVDSWHELKAAVENAFQAGAEGVQHQLAVRQESRNLYPRRYYPSLFWGM